MHTCVVCENIYNVTQDVYWGTSYIMMYISSNIVSQPVVLVPISTLEAPLRTSSLI